MRRNYIMLPENFERRPLPGHRHRPNKDKKVSGTFTPVSRAGRRVPGEAKVKTAMDNNAKKAEEGAADLFKFIKKLNRVSAARPALPGREQTEVKVAPRLIATTKEDDSGSLPSQPPQKRPVADSARSSTCQVISVRRVRSNAMSTSSRAKLELEDMPRSPNISGSTEDTVNLVSNMDSACAYDRARQSFTGEHFHHHELVTATNTVQQHAPFLEHAVHDIVPPAFPDYPATHQLANQPNFIIPEHEAPNRPVEPFWFNAGPAPGFPLHNGFETRNEEHLELERVATACAYAGMGESMEIDPEFPAFIPNDTYADLNLERVAISCAYAGMDEPMDTSLDDTRGPVFDVVPQELQMFDRAGFAQYVPPQQALFGLDVGVQPPMYQTVQQLEHQHFVDEDQRLRPPIHAYPIDQPFQQEHFVVNEMFLQHAVQANDYPVIEEYFPAVPPFDIGHGIHVQAGVPIPLLPIVHDWQPVDRQFELYHRIHEELTQPHDLPIVNETVGSNERTRYQDVGEAEELGHRLDFLNGEAVEPDHAQLFEDLFGTEDVDDEDDDGDEEEEVEVIW